VPLLSCLALAACTSAPPPVAIDAGVLVATREVGPVVTEARLDAWLAWHRALQALPARDGGAGELRVRARVEAVLLADAGLTDAQADAIEAVVAAVVAERSVAKITGAEALTQFKAGLAQLAPEQRVKAEAALADLQAKSTAGSLGPLEAQYGADAVRVVLSREPEVTKTWDALLEARGDRR
jgi:hypothetical protein